MNKIEFHFEHVWDTSSLKSCVKFMICLKLKISILVIYISSVQEIYY